MTCVDRIDEDSQRSSVAACIGANRARRPTCAVHWLGLLTLVSSVIGMATLPSSTRAEDRVAVSGSARKGVDLEAVVAELRERLEAQERRLSAQESLISLQQSRLDAQDQLLESRRGRGEGSERQPVGEPPAPDEPPEVAVLADQGGVLTPRGVLTIEPEVEFTSASSLQFEFSGIGVESAFLIGDIEASSSDRSIFSSRLNARLGLTDRMEVSLDVPYLSRSDRFERRIVSAGDPGGLTDRTRGQGLGDIAVGLHYQFPRSAQSRTTLVGNLRVKSDSGGSPFDVDVDPMGIEEELATGSGYWSIEPSLTWIRPTDPAVLFGTLGYSWNLPVDVDRSRMLNGQPVRVGRVDPGDAISAGFGIGIALNETTSLSLSYNHQYVLRTESELNGIDFLSRPLHVGEFQLGLSFEIADTPARLTASIGVTENAPDVSVSLAMPLNFLVFE